MDPVFFATAAELRDWFERHHASEPEVLVGYYKRSTGKRCVKHSEAVEQALCFGWIDGIGHRIDDERWQVRFTPRRPGSVWSKVNVATVAQLTERGLMHPAGIEAFQARKSDRVAMYAYDPPGTVELDADQIARLQAVPEAWAWYSAQSPWYRTATAHWVASAKRPQTRERRLAELIRESAAGRPVPPLTRR